MSPVRRPSRPRTLNEERAYGTLHQRRRKVLIEQLALLGQAPCPACGLPMTVANRLHLDHSDPAAKQRGEAGDRLIHAVCNESNGGRLGAAISHANGHKPPAARPKPPQPEPLTVDQIDQEMAEMGKHWEGCRCRERIAAGQGNSRCW